MSRQQIVSYTVTCDICGDAIPDDDIKDASRKVSWQGAEYLVDLCSAHQVQLGDTLEQLQVFVTAGERNGRGPAHRGAGQSVARSRPASAGSSATGPAGRRMDLAAIRSWAQQNGHKVGDRGRLPRSVVDAYDQAAGADTPAGPSRRRRRKVAVAN